MNVQLLYMVFNTSNKIVPYSGNNDKKSPNTEKKSPNTEKMNKIILDNQVLKEKQLKIEHNIEFRIKDLDKQIYEYKVKIKNLKKKKKEYNEMKDEYNDESFLSKNCIIL